MEDNYFTIAAESYGEFKDRGSKFFAYAFPMYSVEEGQDRLAAIKKEHFKARHHCYAFRLGMDGNNFRANDDGEPSGTAGRPILGQIDSHQLINVIVVVVRYFGGTKLGTSGLINAYKSSAAAALGNAKIIEKTVKEVYQLEFDYGLMSNIMNTLKALDLEVINQSFTDKGYIDLAIPKSLVSTTLDQLKAGIANIRIEEVTPELNIGGLKLVYKQDL